ncbi:hypothetical protein [Paenibacillus medicaginis]|uniref:Uncharacterized protein n=1 Tax=Paenibacillus medicaginis TaxID=1470560 RepID=A0ABV5BUF1_9BACL
MNREEQWFKDIKSFEWEELDNKTLHIKAGESEGYLIVVGYDESTKDIFVLHEENGRRDLVRNE